MSLIVDVEKMSYLYSDLNDDVFNVYTVISNDDYLNNSFILVELGYYNNYDSSYIKNFLLDQKRSSIQSLGFLYNKRSNENTKAYKDLIKLYRESKLDKILKND
jgi:hypothetical protein